MKTNFEDALWDGSDPDYAPCISIAGKCGTFVYWRCPRRFQNAGYAIRTVRLGRLDKRGDPIPLPWKAKARELTREMVQWYDDNKTRVVPGTWHHLIGRYKSDDFSPIHGIKANTRKSYLYWLDQIDAVMGAVKVDQTTYELLMKVRRGKEAKGRSTHHIHSWFSACAVSPTTASP
jgi:hypothetical protein